MKQLLCAVKRGSKATTYFNEAIKKASELGMIEHVKPNIYKAPFKQQILSNKFNPKELGVILSDGTVKFQTEETAIKFGKNKIVSALNQKFPIEVDVEIGKNGRVLGVVKGDSESTKNIFVNHEELRKDAYISMHGHPDLNLLLGKGYTTAISAGADFPQLQDGGFIKKMIVYNSKGEFYSLTKLNNFNETLDTGGHSGFMKDFYKTFIIGRENEKVLGDITRKTVLDESCMLMELYKTMKKEYDILSETVGYKGHEAINKKAKKVLSESYKRLKSGKLPKNIKININNIYERAEELLDYAIEDLVKSFYNQADKNLIQNTHEFWKQFASKYGVKMETNFAYFA